MSVQLPHNEQSLGMPTLWLQPLSEEPAIKSEGTVAIADGDGWDPLSLGVPSVVVYLEGDWAALGGSGAAVWGGITGTLSNQTDLAAALDTAAAPGGSSGQVQYNNAGAKGGIAGSSWASNQLQLTAQATGVAPFAIQRASGHTGNLLELKSDLGAVMTAFDSDGKLPLPSIRRVTTVSDATSITPNSATTDLVYQANSQAVGTLTMNAPTGTPVEGQSLLVKIKSTNVQTFSWNAAYTGGTVALPTATTGGTKTDYYSFIYDSVASVWRFTGSAGNFT